MEVDGLTYTFDPAELSAGSLLGNRDVEAQLDATSNLVHAWSPSDALFFCGPVQFRFTALHQRRGAVVPELLDPLVTRFSPGHQETILGTEGLILTLRAFVPVETGYERAVGWLVEVQAEGPRLLQIEVDLRFVVDSDQPDRERLVQLTTDRGQIVATSEPLELPRFGLTLGSRNEVRLFGSPSGPPDQVALSQPARARLSYRLLVEGIIEIPFILSYSPAGEQMAWSGFLALSDLDRFAEQSRRTVDRHLAVARVVTPEPRISRAVAWAAATGRRCRHAFPIGLGVADAPGATSVDVGVAAWHAIATDWSEPEASLALLQTLSTNAQSRSGLLAAKIDIRGASSIDQEPPISDATPLFILAAAHHLAAADNRDAVASLWPAVRRAAGALASLVDESGLIRVEAGGGGRLPGWRKSIPGYRLSGPVTEINALAAWALFAAAWCAQYAGEPAAGRPWADAAARVAAALPDLRRTGGDLPALAAGEEDLTGDLVFLLLAGLVPRELGGKIAERLAGDFQWAEGGARTVGLDQPGYDPAFAGGLMGGISPRLTAWVGVAARGPRRGLPVRALRALAALIEPERPGERGLVPGHLPQALHGESFRALGEHLDPLAASLVRWLAIEGLLGLRLPLVPWVREAGIRPALPPEWSWFVVSQLPWRGALVTFIIHDGVAHTDARLPGGTHERWERIEPLPDLVVPAWLLHRSDELRLFVAAPESAYEGTIEAGGRRWAVRLAGGQAALIEAERER